jgi:dihydrofolate reductase
MAAEVRKMKKEPREDMAIPGSGSIVSQLAQEGLIDEYQYVINPVVPGQGKAIFAGIRAKLNLKLTKSRVFSNGNVFLCYEPVA